MDIEARLRAFAAVAREGSFSRAAERLYVSQPAVSKHIASLEAELGAQLITRDPRGATLTPAGQVLADYVLRAEALLANARRALATGAEAQIGTLSLAASGIPGTYLLPGVLARFHNERPAVELDVRLSTSGGSLELVRSHEVEFAVAIDWQPVHFTTHFAEMDAQISHCLMFDSGGDDVTTRRILFEKTTNGPVVRF